MIIDNELYFAKKQAVTVSAAGSKVVDLGVAGDAIGHELRLKAIVNESAAAAGAATVDIALQTSVDEAFTTPITLVSSGAISIDDLVAGKVAFDVRVPKGALRYLRAYFTIATGPLTGGKFCVFINMDA